MIRARFELVLVTNDRIVIRDVGHLQGLPTITNDAENVVDHFRRAGVFRSNPNKRLLYYDSDEELGELLHDCGKFTGFGSVVE